MSDAQPEEQRPADEHVEPTSKQRGSFWRELPVLLGVAIVVAILVRTFLLQTFYIPSESMQNTLDVDDRVLVNKIVYDVRSPQRGEIIVFKAPPSWRDQPGEEDFIKRVIGVGGDRISCCDTRQRLILNGEPLDEPYIFSRNGVPDDAASAHFDIVVPDGRLWVMGDHRSQSGDSMDRYRHSRGNIDEATIAEDAVVGRAFLLFWPLGRMTVLSVPETFDAVPDQPGGPGQPGEQAERGP